MKPLKLSLVYVALTTYSLYAYSAVVLTECNSCYSNSSFERVARIKFVRNNTTVIILNNNNRTHRKYIVTESNSPSSLNMSSNNSSNLIDDQTDGFYNRFAFREYFIQSEKNDLFTFQDILIEVKNSEAILVPDITLGNGVRLDSVWDLVGHSGNQNHFNNYILSNISLLSRFGTWMNNLAARFNITDGNITVKFLFEFSDDSRVLIEVKNELLTYLKFIDADLNDIPLVVPSHPFGATHTDLLTWGQWYSWVQHFRFILEYASSNFNPNTCSILTTTCRTVWRDDEGKDSLPDVKIWVQVCTLDCDD